MLDLATIGLGLVLGLGELISGGILLECDLFWSALHYIDISRSGITCVEERHCARNRSRIPS